MSEVRTIKLHDIVPNPWNPHGMKPEELQALRESVREKGVWRPIVVIEMDATDDQSSFIEAPYRIIDGEHLYKALVAEHLEQRGTDDVTVLVYGKNSEVPLDVQMEIGQTINHGLRGTIEDLEKTGKVVSILAQTRTIDEIARRTGQNLTFLESARRVAEPAVRRVTEGLRVAAERVGQTIPLVFDDNATLAEFQSLIGPAEKAAGQDGVLTPGRRRIAGVLYALRQMVTA